VRERIHQPAVPPGVLLPDDVGYLSMSLVRENAAEELLLDVKVAEASRLYKFYLINEKKILGTISVALFLTAWELVGNTLKLINPMFMSAPSLVFNAAVQMFTSGEIYAAGPWFSTEFKCVFRRRRTGEWVEARGAIFCETESDRITEMRMYWHRWNGGRETSIA